MLVATLAALVASAPAKSKKLTLEKWSGQPYDDDDDMEDRHLQDWDSYKAEFGKSYNRWVDRFRKAVFDKKKAWVNMRNKEAKANGESYIVQE